ncbi:hypothetical protein BKA81DRAFT_210030 [Phyllosticta paracitricarpa]
MKRMDEAVANPTPVPGQLISTLGRKTANYLHRGGTKREGGQIAAQVERLMCSNLAAYGLMQGRRLPAVSLCALIGRDGSFVVDSPRPVMLAACRTGGFADLTMCLEGKRFDDQGDEEKRDGWVDGCSRSIRGSLCKPQPQHNVDTIQEPWYS